MSQYKKSMGESQMDVLSDRSSLDLQNTVKIYRGSSLEWHRAIAIAARALLIDRARYALPETPMITMGII